MALVNFKTCVFIRRLLFNTYLPVKRAALRQYND